MTLACRKGQAKIWGRRVRMWTLELNIPPLLMRPWLQTSSLFPSYMIRFDLYRVSRNTLATYVFSISRLPGHLELKSWKFSWSPFNSDFKTVLILIPIIKIDQISTLRRKKRKLKNINKDNCFFQFLGFQDT